MGQFGGLPLTGGSTSVTPYAVHRTAATNLQRVTKTLKALGLSGVWYFLAPSLDPLPKPQFLRKAVGLIYGKKAIANGAKCALLFSSSAGTTTSCLIGNRAIGNLYRGNTGAFSNQLTPALGAHRFCVSLPSR